MGQESSALQDGRRHRFEWPFVISGLVVFIGVRIWYWLTTREVPFSDMADFQQIAFRIMATFSFEHSPFWQAYKPPLLPILGAAVYSLSSPGNALAWQTFQTVLQLSAILWLALELRRTRVPWWFPAALVWTIALSRPSIFWSLKFSTECLAETGVYAFSAAWLHALRAEGSRIHRSSASCSKELTPWIVAGVISALVVMNRPNFIIALPLAGALLPLMSLTMRHIQRSLVVGVVVGVTCLAVWSPWMIRNYRLYGVPMLGNTSGGFTLIFNLGEVAYRHPDGTVEAIEVNRLLGQAPTRFTNDYEAHRFAGGVFKQWLSDDPKRYLELVWRRVRWMVTAPPSDITLTKVPRDILFGDRFGALGRGVDAVLLDKSVTIFLIGIAGLALLPIVARSAPALLPLIASVPPWVFAAGFQDTSRMLEPMLPMIFFGVIALIAAILQKVPRSRDTLHAGG